MQQMIGELSMEFQKLISYPHQHNFLLIIRYCCNQKILHLERAIGPHILLYSQQFDYLIDTTYAQYFDINFAADVNLAAILSNDYAFSHDNLIQLSRVQLRAYPIDGGMDLLSMLDVDLPAFYAAHVRHLQKLIQEGHSGSLLIHNKSSSLFSNPFQDAPKALLARGAIAVSQDADCSSTNAYHLPDLSFFQQSDPLVSFSTITKTIKGVLNQKQLTNWYRITSPQ